MKEKRKVFISFDFRYERTHGHLLQSILDNPGPTIDFFVLRPEDFPNNIKERKEYFSSWLSEATHTVAVVGGSFHEADSFHETIGTRNWQWWEVEKSFEKGIAVIGAKMDKKLPTPEILLKENVTWANTFGVDSIVNTILFKVP